MRLPAGGNSLGAEAAPAGGGFPVEEEAPALAPLRLGQGVEYDRPREGLGERFGDLTDRFQADIPKEHLGPFRLKGEPPARQRLDPAVAVATDVGEDEVHRAVDDVDPRLAQAEQVERVPLAPRLFVVVPVE